MELRRSATDGPRCRPSCSSTSGAVRKKSTPTSSSSPWRPPGRHRLGWSPVPAKPRTPSDRRAPQAPRDLPVPWRVSPGRFLGRRSLPTGRPQSDPGGDHRSGRLRPCLFRRQIIAAPVYACPSHATPLPGSRPLPPRVVPSEMESPRVLWPTSSFPSSAIICRSTGGSRCSPPRAHLHPMQAMGQWVSHSTLLTPSVTPFCAPKRSKAATSDGRDPHLGPRPRPRTQAKARDLACSQTVHSRKRRSSSSSFTKPASTPRPSSTMDGFKGVADRRLQRLRHRLEGPAGPSNRAGRLHGPRAPRLHGGPPKWRRSCHPVARPLR